MTIIDIKHLAKLANLPVTNEVSKKLEKELEATLQHVDHLNEIDTTQVKGTNDVINIVNETRDDEVKPSLTQKEALQNAKDVHNGFFVVPVIIEEAVEE